MTSTNLMIKNSIFSPQRTTSARFQPQNVPFTRMLNLERKVLKSIIGRLQSALLLQSALTLRKSRMTLPTKSYNFAQSFQSALTTQKRVTRWNLTLPKSKAVLILMEKVQVIIMITVTITMMLLNVLIW